MAVPPDAELAPFLPAIDRFLRSITAERGASPFTVKSYREDLLQLARFLVSAGVGNPAEPPR